MFAKTIIDSDAFLDMPLSTQALYFHLSMRADDDGFINNPKKIQRMIGCSDDDLKLLIAKNFIIPFESGIVVIKHWRIHNYIQKDRYKPTVYQEEKDILSVKDNGVYTMDTRCIQDVSNLEPQVRIGKDSLDKDRKEEVSIVKDSTSIEQLPAAHDNLFEYLWEIYPNKKGKKQAELAFKRALKKGTTVDEIREGIKAYVRYINEMKIEHKYVKQGGTFFNQEAWKDDWTPSKPKGSVGSFLEEMKSW